MQTADVLTFHILGSSGDSYVVRAGSKTPGKVFMTCTCPAGAHGIYCKHRFALLAGDASMLMGNNSADVEVLAELVKGSDVEAALAKVTVCEASLKTAQVAVAKAKKDLARAMYDQAPSQ